MAKNKVYSQFGDKLRRVMQDEGISQNELSARTGIEQGTISNYVTGKMHPQFHTADVIARAIGCSLDEFRDDPLGCSLD